MKFFKSAFFILGVIFVMSCSETKHEIYKADLSVFYDTTSSVKTKQYEGAQAGGGDVVEKDMIKKENTACTASDEGVLIKFSDSSGYVEAVIEGLDLPKDWKKFKILEYQLENPNDFNIKTIFNIYGARNRFPSVKTISAGETIVEKMRLEDLPLTARNKNKYQPNAIHIDAEAQKAEFSLLLKNIQLIKTGDTVPAPVVDQFGQRIRADWPGKITSVEDMIKSKKKEKEFLDKIKPEKKYDKYGGWLKGKKFEATGFFRVEESDGHWWFVTPVGNPFWSLGVTGVRSKYTHADVTKFKNQEYLFEALPDKEKYPYAYERDSMFSNYCWNILRKYGSIENWKNHSYKRLRAWGMNTIGNWSERTLIESSPIPFTYSYRTNLNKKMFIGGRFCDYFNPAWKAYTDSIISDAKNFKDNKYLIGFFIDNEQSWHHAELLNRADKNIPMRNAWLELVQNQYKKLDVLNNAWQTNFSSWDEVKNMKMLDDNSEFSEVYKMYEKIFAEEYFSFIRKTLKKYAPNHLYLGCRFTRKLKPDHILDIAGKYMDVVTVNVYSLVPIKEQMTAWHEKTGRPILIGEHHLPLRSNRQMPPKYKAFTPEERLKWYPEYIRTWAKMPFSLGAHWYQYADQHLTGRAIDGENQTVGLVDIADQPYEHMIDAVRIASKEMYKLHQKSGN